MADVHQAKGTFEVESNSKLYDQAAGAQLFRTSYRKTFHGDIEATSQVEVLRAMAETEGSGAYVGIERINGSVQGRSGTFVLQHSGTMDRGRLSSIVAVVPDTGTGQLSGIRGEMILTVVPGKSHSYEFNYSVED